MSTLINNKVKIQKHIFYVATLTFIALTIAFIFPTLTFAVPLLLIFTLLIYQNRYVDSKKQATLLNKALLLSLPFAMLIAEYLYQYPITLPLVFLVYMLLCKLIHFEDNYVFSGILLMHAYFSSETWKYYVFIVILTLLYSQVAKLLARTFAYSIEDEFFQNYRDAMVLFKKMIVCVFHNEYINVSEFYESLRQLQYQFSLVAEAKHLTHRELLQLDQLLYELEEAYFYLRNLVEAPVSLTPMLFESYQAVGVKLNRQQLLLGESPYNFHAKNLLRHYRQVLYLEQLLKEGGLGR